MSIHHLSQVWDDRSITSRCELLVLLAIADYARADGLAWPSIDSLAAKARCSQRAVQDVISRLISQKKLEVKYGAGPFGTNVYRVLAEGVQPLHPAASRPKIRPEIRALAAPNPSGTVRNGYDPSTKGKEHPRFPKDYQILIEAAQDRRQELKDRHSPNWVDATNELAEFRDLGTKVKQWRKAQLNLMLT